MQLISKYNKAFQLLMLVIDIYSKYTRTVPLQSKIYITTNNAIQKALDELNVTPNKIWVNKGRKFHKRSTKLW